MSESHPSLPWLERLGMRVPGHPGYHSSARRREADTALREAIVHRLDAARDALEHGRARCVSHELHSEAEALGRIAERLAHVVARVRSASSGVSPFYEAGDFRPSKADALHASDHAMLEVVDEFVEMCRHASPSHDWLARLGEEVEAMEQRLDRRSKLHHLASE
jgi:hypothetical protein